MNTHDVRMHATPTVSYGGVKSPSIPLRNPLHPSVVDKLDPAFVKLYNDYIANGPPWPTDINLVRQNYSALYSYATAPPSGVGGIGETTVPGWEKYPGEVNVRVYVPPGEEPTQRKVWPAHFNFHGGGWAVGDLETDAHICHHICASVPCCVIDIEYRHIPEYPFPVGIMDSLTAVAHILANHKTFSIDSTNITFGGESSGGTIALILNHLFRDGGFSDKLKGVVVATPTIGDVRKYATPDMSPWPSMKEFEFAPLLNWDKLKWFDTFKWMSLASQNPGIKPKEQRRDISWFADAMNAPDFKNLAPVTYLATAEVDPLRDEAEGYAKKLEEAGNKVILKRFRGMPHHFMHMDRVLPQAREYVQDVIFHVRQCLYPPQEPATVTTPPAT
ncbi:esterase [Cladophialophora carrionii]|uniref:Esterase n=1 Tax=Cladophialophora carrionii TaxID=86049 RepID=A0A1C1CAK4_9EURO|nr:esterase [Cladophialophora carrionii]